MGASCEDSRKLLFLLVAASACNGQFDFDTALLDAEAPGISEVGSADIATSEAATDVPRTGVRIACGASECSSVGCCATAGGTSCIDAADGGMCGGLVISCDDTEDCPAGQVCCAEGESNCAACGLRPQRVHCEPESHCRAMNFTILCNPYRPSPCTQCVATTLTGLPPGYHQCPLAP
jgi:hypothetical protein